MKTIIMMKNLRTLIMNYQIKSFYIIALLLFSFSVKAYSQEKNNNLEYFDDEKNYLIEMEIPSINKIKSLENIKKQLKSHFEEEIKKYDNYLLNNNPRSQLSIKLEYKIDSVYLYENIIIIVYNVYQENLPAFSKIHWIDSFTYDKRTGEKVILNICNFINCKSIQIPLYKIVNLKLSKSECLLNSSKKLFLKHFIPLPNDKFLIYIWNDLAKDPKKCDAYETFRLEFTKQELQKIIDNIDDNY